jgi:hypothetical protein
LVVGSTPLKVEALCVSTSMEVAAVALSPDCTFPNAWAPASACATALSFDAFRDGTANRPIGPSEFAPRFRPRRPAEIEDRRDCRSPALPWRRCIDESFMEKPVLPVGPELLPTGVGAGGVGAGFVETDGLGLTFPLAIAGSPGDD